MHPYMSRGFSARAGIGRACEAGGRPWSGPRGRLLRYDCNLFGLNGYARLRSPIIVRQRVDGPSDRAPLFFAVDLPDWACMIFIDIAATGCKGKTSRIRFRRYSSSSHSTLRSLFDSPCKKKTFRSPIRACGPGRVIGNPFRQVAVTDPWKGGMDMDIRDERYLDFVAMLLIGILLLGLTFFEMAMMVLSRSSQG